MLFHIISVASGNPLSCYVIPGLDIRKLKNPEAKSLAQGDVESSDGVTNEVVSPRALGVVLIYFDALDVQLSWPVLTSALGVAILIVTTGLVSRADVTEHQKRRS